MQAHVHAAPAAPPTHEKIYHHLRIAPIISSIAFILGVDRFRSEARTLTNLIGNGVATVVVARWEGALDVARMRLYPDHETAAEADSPAYVLVEEEEAAGMGTGIPAGTPAKAHA